jgi:ABC-type nitrate/sulfonate/bicarbonate transport system substrate-binding protein
MDKIVFALLRGVCQLPAYLAQAKGFLRDVGIDAELSIAPTAWTVPQRLVDGEVHFAVIPWTRVAADKSKGNRLTLISRSGFEEASCRRRGSERRGHQGPHRHGPGA